MIGEAEGHSRIEVQPVESTDFSGVDGLSDREALPPAIPDLGAHHHLPPLLIPNGHDIHRSGPTPGREDHVTEHQPVRFFGEGGLEIRELHHVGGPLPGVSEHPFEETVEGRGHLGA